MLFCCLVHVSVRVLELYAIAGIESLVISTVSAHPPDSSVSPRRLSRSW